ncbi:MAG: FHA domain-containing protein [Anaerolineae bacterium]
MVRYIAESEEDFKTLQEPPPHAYLVLLVGGRPSQSFPLRGELNLGRDKENAIVVADQKVSRRHASLTPIDETYILTDLGSANGTFLNGVQIAQPTRLKHLDRLTVGDTIFLFNIGQPDLSAPERPAPSAPIVMPRPAAASASLPSSTFNTVWIVVGCMAVTIIGLMLALALLLGFYMGSSQF